MFTRGPFGIDSRVKDEIYARRYDEFKAQGKDPAKEIAREDLAIMKEFFLHPFKFFRRLFQ
ncbi:hypothetical protein HN858_00795 [Candidatus Falkowbacteria bacterium]|jgi:hypothetical protein|nr:hypothetical protein [Candidatus Falkowbacteria bacterium]MBT5503114.1 hypothetical protein [Candidatus Falkowbacteria bacterium]MBT6573908.1 hypothetical protein [Candidatus Falkowbacteria bacterium]MBT7348191.1 hypothetical protein [Candidatus Falkowbacteria bacterium]MBT7501251.1 hypothetical protein [Candidatus Falkowbacteria bacterium]